MNDFKKPKFRMHIDKPNKGDLYFGLLINQVCLENWLGGKVISKDYERYICICVFKYMIQIGWLWK